MKRVSKPILALCMLMFLCATSNAQSKRDQIESLNHTVDSLKSTIEVLFSESVDQQVNMGAEINSLKTQLTDTENLRNEIQSSLDASEKAVRQLTLDKANLELKLLSVRDSLINSQSSNQEVAPIEVTIGTQIWMTNNLEVSTFRNGSPIPQAKSKEEWDNAEKNKQPAWCYYENSPVYGAKYGKLYNWFAVNDPRGLAPEGYHIPTDSEWTILEDFLGVDAGKKNENILWLHK